VIGEGIVSEADPGIESTQGRIGGEGMLNLHDIFLSGEIRDGVERAVHIDGIGHGRPPHSEVQRQLARGLPVVLEVRSEIDFAKIAVGIDRAWIVVIHSGQVGRHTGIYKLGEASLEDPNRLLFGRQVVVGLKPGDRKAESQAVGSLGP
jgi:hypothetical protein